MITPHVSAAAVSALSQPSYSSCNVPLCDTQYELIRLAAILVVVQATREQCLAFVLVCVNFSLSVSPKSHQNVIHKCRAKKAWQHLVLSRLTHFIALMHTVQPNVGNDIA